MIDPIAIRLELGRILQSRVFERAQRSQRFLRYVVEAALTEPPVSVKEYIVAIDVFDRDTSYDPSVDATVRVEASRLRSRLREYYTGEGRDDTWQFDIPKGGYNIVFTPGAIPGSTSLEQPLNATPHLLPPARIVSASRLGLWAGGVAVLLVALGATAVWQYRRAGPLPAAPAEPISLAILPISNHTGDSNLKLMADGLTDDLIRQLSAVPALRLIGRATMFRYQDRAASAPAIAKSLHVNTIMSGELRRTPEHTSLVVEVVRTSDGSVLLDREYIAGASDLRTVQADLQRDILTKLNVEGSAVNPGRALHSVTANPEAYREFLEGNALLHRPYPAALHQAIHHFENAVALDPQFDLAWSGLASCHVYLGIYFEAPRDQMPLARHFAQRALEINPTIGDAHATLGLVRLLYDWNLDAAHTEMSAADARAAAFGQLSCSVHLMEQSGKPRNAEEMLNRLLTYDPQSCSLVSELGCVNYYRRNYEVALRYYRAALLSDPQAAVAAWGIGKTLNAQAKYVEAIKALRSFKEHNGFEPPIITAEIGYAIGAAGRRKQALEIARALSANRGPGFHDPYLVSLVYLSTNDRDSVFEWLNKAIDVRSPFAISILSEPKWQPFRSDPRFAQAVQRMITKKA